MKNNKKYIKLITTINLLLLVSSVFLSCDSQLDINSDPNNPTKVPIATLLTSSEVNLTYNLGGNATRVPASVVQHYAGHRGQPLDYTQFNITSSSSDRTWTNMYDVLNDLKNIENQGTSENKLVFVGIAQIMQAYTYSITSDLFGDIPFTESLQGIANINPAYDKQEQIYPSLIALIDTGISNVRTNTGANPGAADLVYGGNIVKWERFANSLKLRLLNHLSKRNPTAAFTFLQTNPLLIDITANNAKVGYGITAANANPIYQFDVLSGRKDNAVCKTLVDKMQLLSDPRIDFYFFKVVNNAQGFGGQYRGNIPGGGTTEDPSENLYSRVGSAYASISSPVMLMSAAELNFIKSEVYFRANDLINSKTFYDKAITEDMLSLTVTGANTTTYLANPLVAYNNSLSRIMEQKWITMFQASYESWVDWRRTGFPALTFPSVNFTSNIFPRRLPYPQIEINVNGQSLTNGPGIPIPFETLKTRVWWDLL